MTTKVSSSLIGDRAVDSLQLANTAVSAGTYGGTTQHAVLAVDAQGRLTFAANATPSIATSQLTGSIGANQMANTQSFGITTTGAAGSVSSGSWTISISGTKVYFAYSGANVFSVDSSGNIIAKGDVTGFGTP